MPRRRKTGDAGKLDDYRKTIARYETEPETREGKKELLARARDHEKQRDHALKQDPYFDYAEALLQIAIVLISVAIIAEPDVAGVFRRRDRACSACCLMINGFICWWRSPAPGVRRGATSAAIPGAPGTRDYLRRTTERRTHAPLMRQAKP